MFRLLAVGQQLPDLSAYGHCLEVQILATPEKNLFDQRISSSSYDFVLVSLEQPSKSYIGLILSISRLEHLPTVFMFGPHRFSRSHVAQSFPLDRREEYLSLCNALYTHISQFADALWKDIKTPRLPNSDFSSEVYNLLLGGSLETCSAIYTDEIKKHLKGNSYYVFIQHGYADKYVSQNFPALQSIYKRLDNEIVSEYQSTLTNFNGGIVIQNGWREIIVISNGLSLPSATAERRFGYNLAVALHNCINSVYTFAYMLGPAQGLKALANEFECYKSLQQHRMFFRELRVLGLENYKNRHRQADQDTLNNALNTIASYSLSSDDNELIHSLNTLFHELKMSADLTSYYYCASNLNVIFRNFCTQYHINIPYDYHFYDYKKKWIEDICEDYINMFLDAKRSAAEAALYGDITLWQIKRYIDRNYAQKISLEDLCGRFRISKSHLCQSFRKKLNTTVIRYVNEVRVANAKQILLTENISIAQLAEKVGFDDAKYFNRVFKQVTGTSPKQYVQMLRQKYLLQSNTQNKAK